MSKYFICHDQRARESIHTTDVRIEKILHVGRVPPEFSVEINTAACKAPSFQNDQHRFCKLVDIIRELVSIPSVLIVTAVCIHASQYACVCRYLQFVRESMTGECSVVYFEVDLEIVQ